MSNYTKLSIREFAELIFKHHQDLDAIFCTSDDGDVEFGDTSWYGAVQTTVLDVDILAFGLLGYGGLEICEIDDFLTVDDIEDCINNTIMFNSGSKYAEIYFKTV